MDIFRSLFLIYGIDSLFRDEDNLREISVSFKGVYHEISKSCM